MAVKARDEVTLVRVDDGAAGKNGQMLYATCNTASATVAKVATLETGTLTLKAGSTVAVKFTYANNAASPTLNIGGTGKKAIYTQGVRYAYWAAGATVIFTYDGTYWRVASEPVYANVATIGNPSGRNIYIDGSKVYIRDGTTVLAAFAADEISLGENSSSSVIKMCGDNIEFGVVSIDGEQHNYLHSVVLNISVKKPNEMGAASSAGLFMQGDTVDISGNLKYKENPIEDLLKWNLLKEVSGTTFGSVTIPSLSFYREYLLTVGPWASGNTALNNRILASAVIPVGAMINSKGYEDANGVHQAYYSSKYWSGLNCANDTTIQIRASGFDAIAKLWAR